MSDEARLADACIHCGAALLLCEHAVARLTDHMLELRGQGIVELESALAQARVRVVEVEQAAKSILWMAEKYAEGGGSHSIEMEEYEAAAAILGAAGERG